METEANSRVLVLELRETLDPEAARRLCAELNSLPGVRSVQGRDRVWSVSYAEEALSAQTIETVFKSKGAVLAPPEKPKGFLTRWLDSLAEANRRRWGDNTPDCCKLSSEDSHNRSA